MSHGFPKRLRRHREKRPKLTQVKPKVKPSATNGLIAELANPTRAAFSEALKEVQKPLPSVAEVGK